MFPPVMAYILEQYLVVKPFVNWNEFLAILEMCLRIRDDSDTAKGARVGTQALTSLQRPMSAFFPRLICQVSQTKKKFLKAPLFTSACLPTHLKYNSLMCVLSCSVTSNSLWPQDCSPPGSSVHGSLFNLNHNRDSGFNS